MADREPDHILDALVNHITLPPRLPFRDDLRGGTVDRAIAQRLQKDVRAFRQSVDVQYYAQWSLVCRTMDQFSSLHTSANRHLDKNSLIVAFNDLSASNSDSDTLILQITTQNAGLIIRKEKAVGYVFEAFEVSPRAADVLASKTALQWDFPSRAVAISARTFEDPSFQEHTAKFLEQASIENIKDFAATVRKAGSNVFESRDTANPVLIGQLLMALLEANGQAHNPTITRKRIRDDVCWSDGAENPWRRSPTWLLLRVGILRTLCQVLGGNKGILHYKFFIAHVIARLCEDFSELDPARADYLAHARAKLARRLAKLQTKKSTASPGLSTGIDEMFSNFEDGFTKTFQAVNDRLATEWTNIRQRSRKQIFRLPPRADDASLFIRLLNSGQHLQRLCQQPLPPWQSRWNADQASYLTTYSQNKSATNVQALQICHYLDLADFESQVARHCHEYSSLPLESATHSDCIELAKEIRAYQQTALSAYESNPEELSIMLLTILDLWTSLDSMATQLFPLLLEYEPGIPVGILHVLQLSRMSDLYRLREVENHLRIRHTSANHALPSAFEDPSGSCFAVRYFAQCETMKALFHEITCDGDRARAQKELEWDTKSAEYEALLKKAAENTCLRVIKENMLGESYTVHDYRNCVKCGLESAARAIRIGIIEHPLPDDQNAAKAAVFELLCPQGFAAWRDTTWNIMSKLGHETILDTFIPKVIIQDYSGLCRYGTREPNAITLASTTKSLLSTHFAPVPFPVKLDEVCVRNNLRLRLYDREQKIWPARQKTAKPTFSHHCTSSFPPKSSFSSLSSTLRMMSDNVGRSANEIIASQTDCPNTLTVFEYQAFQELLAGTKLRWVQLLRELASPNINFGTLTTVKLVSQLALQVGAPWGAKVLRINHWVFEDVQFCRSLAEQIRNRLEAIRANWRETQNLECLLTLANRLWELGASIDVTTQAAILLKDIRATAFAWTRSLRQEILGARDSKTAQLRSRDALFAAMLFRRTYVLEISNSLDCFEPETLACFIECSVTMYDNLPEDKLGRMSKLPLYMRNMYVRDLKLVHCLKRKICQSIRSMSASVDDAMNNIWPAAANVPPRVFTHWTFLSSPFENWVTAQSVETSNTRAQEIHYNIIEGSLLVDQQKLSRLPEEYTSHWFFLQLLGDRLNFTYPSPMPGMNHMLAAPIEGNEVHFGFRGGSAFLRVVQGPRVLELIPPGLFCPTGAAEDADLPMALIADHFHWLDLSSRTLLIRPAASKWRSKESDWVLDIRTGHALRRGRSSLLDVRSPIFQRIVRIFEPFEHQSRILAFQPRSRPLTVQLPKLEISFFVNDQGLLQSPQLRAMIDDDQDAGTLYGFNSKIVLCDASIRRERSVIIAMGPTNVTQYMGHVRVTSEHTGFYCRFSINTILNRLDCPPEPRVIYMKAYCHAITSFVLPDPLTGRTGTEEALDNLSNGIAQPWAPVDSEAHRWLLALAALSPKRVYYPTALKVNQKVFWRESVSFAAQDDRIHPAVAQILNQCTQLYRFNPGSVEQPSADPRGEDHLLHRAHIRNSAHRLENAGQPVEQYSDSLYSARDRVSSAGQANAFQAAKLVKQWSRKILVAANLAELLEKWPLIEGYCDNDTFQRYLLDELISLNVASRWGSLFNHCRNLSRKKNVFGAMFFFATIAFGGRMEMTLVRTLIAITVMEEFQFLSVPRWDSFAQFCKKSKPTIDYLVQLMDPAVTPYPRDERSLLGGISLNYKQHRALVAAQDQYEQSTKEIREAVAQAMLLQWPCETPSVIAGECSSVNMDVAILLVRPEWLRFFQNYELWEHIVDVQRILDSCEAPNVINGLRFEAANMKLYPTFTITGSVPRMQAIVEMTASLESPHVTEKLSCNKENFSTAFHSQGEDASSTVHGGTSTHLSQIFIPRKVPRLVEVQHLQSEGHELQEIIDPFIHIDDSVRNIYGDHLCRSLKAFQNLKTGDSPDSLTVDRGHLNAALLASENAVKSQLHIIRMKLSSHPSFRWLSYGGLWPCSTPVEILKTLSKSSCTSASGPLREAIIKYGILITTWQRLLRIETASNKFDQAQLRDLFENKGHLEWTPSQYPDWLLLEIEMNILIRTDQYLVAKAMIAPESGSNSVLQMNMGQGKSSVIIPMIAAILADRKRLFRVIVPKPLLLQMAQLLQIRLGGLLGRTIKHVPFSRRSSTSRDNIRAYVAIHQECLNAKGVILALPEHLLSFKLSGLQQLSSERLEDAAVMMRAQSWLVSKFRDVLDECDYSLAVKTQLVYPSGTQRTVDGHPHRWKVVESVLSLVKRAAEQLQLENPRSIEITGRGSSGRFPAIHFLQDAVKETLIQCITTSVCKGEGELLPINDCTNHELQAINDLLHKQRFTKEELPVVVDLFKDRQPARQGVLLLRGLLVHRILLMALGRRWNVQYGLHPKRDPVAVPYHAKGVPSDQAEFGHPDVAILLTCLSFYYSGLDEAQFEQVLRQVLKSDDPAIDFDAWIQDAKTLPDSMCTWAAINVDDEIQRKELWNHLHYNMIVVNSFLNNFVFPRHAKTFERKIVSSGWDIPSPPSYHFAIDRSHGRVFPEEDKQIVKHASSVTTGFSGTNDNRTLLPLNIEQRDLPGLSHTNAEVLTYLLQQRNRKYFLVADDRGKRLTEYRFLRMIFSHGIRMLLDAGAQILELDNQELVRTWLTIDHEAEAAVFFDKEDKARVLYKDGRSQPLVGSHFVDNLGACLVYLDEAHTRGTDLKMPATAKAALTLGPGQTKDHTVQAAMRLRLLATTQAVVFFAPPEVHQSILNFRGKSFKDWIDSHDVVSWLLEQSCRSIEQIQPLYISQGLDFCQRTSSATVNHKAATNAEHRSRYLKVLEQPEHYSLEHLYAPVKKLRATPIATSDIPLLSSYVNKLSNMRENLRETSETVQASTYQEVEQEREVAIEVETVREVKKPTRATALKHLPLHEDLVQFVKRGRKVDNSSSYEQVFKAMRRTGVGMRGGIYASALTSKLYVTSDFMGIIQVARGQSRDEYLRPVQWIIVSTVSDAAIIVSPHEAEALLDQIRDAETPRTHLVIYAAPVTRNTLAFDTLRFYTVPTLPPTWRAPSWLVRDLGIFAGRLYFDYANYPPICQKLGLPSPGAENLCDELPFAYESDDHGADPFTEAPLEFMQQWLTVRRKGQDFSQTPMGFVCSGKEIREDAVFFGR